MTARPRLFIGTLAACGVFIALQALVSFATPATPNSACDQLRAWAAPYKNASPTLDEVATFDRAHRLAIFGALTPTVRASLWREQLQRFDAQSGLTSEQHALIREAVTMARPELYEGNQKATEAYGSFWRRAAPAFTSASHRRAWFDLGSVVPGVPPTASRVPYCECSLAEGSYGCARGCITSWCNSWGPGCGSIGYSHCDGMCG